MGPGDRNFLLPQESGMNLPSRSLIFGAFLLLATFLPTFHLAAAETKKIVFGYSSFGSITDNLSRILLRKYGLEGSVSVRQLGGTIEVGAAFQQRAIAGAVTSDLRVPANFPVKMLLQLVDLGIPYSMNLLAVSRDYYRRNPEIVDGMVRSYAEGVAALNRAKEPALKVIAKYA